MVSVRSAHAVDEASQGVYVLHVVLNRSTSDGLLVDHNLKFARREVTTPGMYAGSVYRLGRGDNAVGTQVAEPRQLSHLGSVYDHVEDVTEPGAVRTARCGGRADEVRVTAVLDDLPVRRRSRVVTVVDDDTIAHEIGVAVGYFEIIDSTV